MSDGNNNIEYRIKTTADVRGLQDVAKGLKDQIKLSKEAGQSAATLERELVKVNAALNSQKGSLGSQAVALEKTIASMAKAKMDVSGLVAERNALLHSAGMSRPSAFGTAASAFADAGGGFGGVRAAAGTFGAGAALAAGGMAAALAVGKKALDEYGESEEKQIARDQALKQRRQYTQEYAKSLDDLSDAMQESTAIDNDTWTGAITTLTQGGAGPGNMAKAVDAVKNAAGLPQMFGNIQAAAEAVSRAMNGNFEAFTRMGFVLSDQATDAEKLEEVYSQLATRGGGQLEARAQSLNGQFRSLGLATGDFFKALGKGIADTGATQSVIYGLSTSLSWLAKVMGGGAGMADLLKRGVRDASDEMETAEQRADRLRKKLDEIKKSAADADKERAKYSEDLGKEAQEQLDLKMDQAAQQLAAVDLNEKQKWITPEEATARRQGIRRDVAEFKQMAEMDKIDLEIEFNKKQQLEAQKKVTDAMADKAAQEEKLAEFQKLDAKRQEMTGRLDSKIEARKQAIKEKVIGQSAAGEDVEMALERAYSEDPEILALEYQRSDEKNKFRRRHGPVNVEKQQDAVDEAKKVLDTLTDPKGASAESFKKLVTENNELGRVREIKADRFRTQSATMALQNVAERTPAPTEGQPGIDQQRIRSQVLGAMGLGHTSGQSEMDVFMRAALGAINEGVAATRASTGTVREMAVRMNNFERDYRAITEEIRNINSRASHSGGR